MIADCSGVNPTDVVVVAAAMVELIDSAALAVRASMPVNTRKLKRILVVDSSHEANRAYRNKTMRKEREMDQRDLPNQMVCCS